MDAPQSSLLIASIAGLLAAVSSPRASAESAGGKVPCYGINKCAGVGACAGQSSACNGPNGCRGHEHGCAGKNACAGQGYLELDQQTCLKIQGGRLTADAPEQKS